MPELVEVDVTRRVLEDVAAGQRIVAAEVADDSKVFVDISSSSLKALLEGKIITEVHRCGKQLWVEFGEHPEALFVHLGMSGAVLVKGRDTVVYRRTSADSAASWPPRFWKLTLELGSGAQLALTDPRRFARVKLGPPAPPPHLGWDPLLSWPSFLAFSDKLGATRRSTKAVLLDQTVCAGVGNWIADEALYQARIHPEQVASDLDQSDVQRLHRLIPEICSAAIAVDANAAKLPEHWMFHARWSKASKAKPTVGGFKIAFATVAGRTSAFVPELQVLRKRGHGTDGAAKTDVGDEGRGAGSKRPRRGKSD